MSIQVINNQLPQNQIGGTMSFGSSNSNLNLSTVGLGDKSISTPDIVLASGVGFITGSTLGQVDQTVPMLDIAIGQSPLSSSTKQKENKVTSYYSSNSNAMGMTVSKEIIYQGVVKTEGEASKISGFTPAVSTTGNDITGQSYSYKMGSNTPSVSFKS